MKKKELGEIKNKNKGQLQKMVSDLRKELSNMHIESSMGKIKNLHQIKNKKKDIARVLTVLSFKQLEPDPKEKNKE